MAANPLPTLRDICLKAVEERTCHVALAHASLYSGLVVFDRSTLSIAGASKYAIEPGTGLKPSSQVTSGQPENCALSRIHERQYPLEIVPQSLFPSPVWTTVFSDRISFNSKMLEQANRLRAADPTGVKISNLNGWQSPAILQNLSEFADMNLRILQVCSRIAESQHFKPNLNFQHHAWVNISPPGASNKVHYHANCHFSGVYYISLQAPQCGSIYFRDPRVASRMLPYPVTKGSEFTADEVRMQPEEGRIYVFPGWLEHGVEVNQSNRDRVSISFNVLALP